MKKLLLSLVFLQCGVMMAAKPKPNPADYTVTVHVLFSRGTGPWNSAGRQVLEAVVDGQPMEMQAEARSVLLPGDYKAKLISMKSWQKQIANDYEVAPTYEFLFDDGTTREYVVTGEGAKGGSFIPGSDASGQ